jgi:carbonic anhydrase
MGDRADISWLFEQNKAWADKVKQSDPDFFSNLADQQQPELLWIGCADSRVPANQITGLPPGEVFVHRNIANVVVHSDLNCLSVIQYAVEVLNVKHIVICGHYGCGGVAASLEDQSHGLIDNWLEHIRNVYRLHAEELDAIDDKAAQISRLCELNVVEQTHNVCNTTIVKDAWARGQDLTVHGIVYSIQNGILKDLLVRTRPAN